MAIFLRTGVLISHDIHAVTGQIVRICVSILNAKGYVGRLSGLLLLCPEVLCTDISVLALVLHVTFRTGSNIAIS